jgi:hypothetical protein
MDGRWILTNLIGALSINLIIVAAQVKGFDNNYIYSPSFQIIGRSAPKQLII